MAYNRICHKGLLWQKELKNIYYNVFISKTNDGHFRFISPNYFRFICFKSINLIQPPGSWTFFLKESRHFLSKHNLSITKYRRRKVVHIMWCYEKIWIELISSDSSSVIVYITCSTENIYLNKSSNISWSVYLYSF